ncbi:hypothetical protein BDV95DRAFT_562449 [Massariosphaeria phaeospora]|uniref:Ribosomal protein L22/L17 n=1 Tax=Massariosphaeria phaeospora TaxID=100035 RepID=A0A7C8MFL3_9PLEO|nr:hypothetical protein BDV95DRAFT_562449 [Massariosphaeria phaeospora]
MALAWLRLGELITLAGDLAPGGHDRRHVHAPPPGPCQPSRVLPSRHKFLWTARHLTTALDIDSPRHWGCTITMSARIIVPRRLGQSARVAYRGSSAFWIPSSAHPVKSCSPVSNPFTRHYAEKPSTTQPTPEAAPTPKTPSPEIVPKDASTPTPSPETPSKSKSGPDLSNPMLEKYLQKQRTAPAESDSDSAPPAIRTGKLAPSTIFAPEVEMPGYRDGMTPSELAALKSLAAEREKRARAQREYDLRALAIDPVPEKRKRWERKTIIRSLERRGRVTRDIQLARTERQNLYKSPNLPTSWKKMTRVMHQIAGKSVDDALLQLRFSKKKIARDVAKGLAVARNEAITSRGMGLGGAAMDGMGEATGGMGEATGDGVEEATEPGSSLFDAAPKPSEHPPQVIDLKDGSRKLITDPTAMYIDQAWVGKGERWKMPEFRARGRINTLIHQSTSFSVLLKEEKTRVRLSDERRQKRAARKVWVALPDRPVVAQRQYCLW